ncbi:manganese catalase family protein [Anaerosporobacter faecicola]|uniref:manganese catalase family protein n=1 Tax=Anaerosporobacter faecicola TaxID=2718714 RepID=UPI00143C2804|nr:manganese catalase family protein [Anaerosporobacter faecicola]
MEILSAILYQLTKEVGAEHTVQQEKVYVLERMDVRKEREIPEFRFTLCRSKENVLMFLHEDMAAEQKAQALYDRMLSQIHNPEVCDPIRFLRMREIVHYQRLGEALQLVQEKIETEG